MSECGLFRALCGAALVAASSLDAAEIGPAQLDRLPAADVVILGEVHDNPVHHANQARAVAAIEPAALVFEMLTPEQAMRVPSDRSDASAVARALDWSAGGWPDFAMYHPIFLAAPDAEILGGDLPAGQVRRAVTEGAAALFGPGADRFGLTASLDPADQATREAGLLDAHCNALPPDVLPGMVEAQRLRDAALARAVIAAHDATSGPVAVITGNGHARRDQGIASVLRLAAPGLSVLSVGQLEGSAAAGQPFDFWIETGTIPRDDPCAAFGTETRLAVPGRPMAG